VKRMMSVPAGRVPAQPRARGGSSQAQRAAVRARGRSSAPREPGRLGAGCTTTRHSPAWRTGKRGSPMIPAAVSGRTRHSALRRSGGLPQRAVSAPHAQLNRTNREPPTTTTAFVGVPASEGSGGSRPARARTPKQSGSGFRAEFGQGFSMSPSSSGRHPRQKE